MSPIIDLQRRMMEAGRIRAGDRDQGHPRKLDKWRLTSKDKQRLDRASELWGGTVRQWLDRPDEWELHTDTSMLPIMLLPGQPPTTWYELWSKGGAQRRCDGQHELITDGECLCDPDDRECKPYTRLSVLLPDLPGIGSWLVQSTGWNAANEIAGAADLLGKATAQGVLLPARLRLEQRTSVKQGQTRKFAVPVIDIDVSFRELMGGTAPKEIAAPTKDAPPVIEAAAPSYVPLAEIPQAVTLQEGLAVAAQERQTRSGRQAAPIPDVDDIPFGDEPVPVTGDEPPSKTADYNPTEKQKKKLDVLVGTLRGAGHITTEQLYAAISKARNLDPEINVELTDGARDPDGTLHWGPLRDSLTRGEATDLIDRLGRLEANVRAVGEETA